MTLSNSSSAASLPPLPTLSVVVPNYNHACYLEGALGAHLRQSLPPLEVIVVDDASTDNSREVVTRLSATQPTLRLVRHGQNRGVNAAMNRGLGEAKGDYVCFSAADDLVRPEFAARSLAAVAKYPTAGFCFSEPAELLGDSGIIRRFPLALSKQPCLLSPREVERLLAHNYFSFSSNTILYRREFLLKVGGFVEDLLWYADWFADLLLAFRYGACYVPEVLALFRVSDRSYSAQGVRDASTQRALLCRVMDLLQEDAYRDVAGCYRRAAIVPEMRARSLRWLLGSSRHRRYVSPRLCVRLLFGEIWWRLMPYTPEGLRQAARWLIALPTRWRLAGRRKRTP